MTINRNPYNSRSYKHIREVIIYLANYKCEICNKKYNNFDVHHIDKNNRNNSIENLLCLCKNCHVFIHKSI